MCRVRALFLFLMLGILLLSVKEVSAQAAGLQAEWVLYNGKVLTANSEDPANFAIVEAVAIYDGKFVAVGDTREVLEFAGPDTRPDRNQRFSARQLDVRAHGHCGGYLRHVVAATKRRAATTLSPHFAEYADHGPADARGQYGTIYSHLQHSRRQWRAHP